MPHLKTALGRSAASTRQGPAGMRTFERIADAWGLSHEERHRLLGMSASTYYRARANPERVQYSSDLLERLSHVLGVYKALHVLFPQADRADAWIDRPSRHFGDQPARARLTSGSFSDLVSVRNYLDAQRGW